MFRTLYNVVEYLQRTLHLKKLTSHNTVKKYAVRTSNILIITNLEKIKTSKCHSLLIFNQLGAVLSLLQSRFSHSGEHTIQQVSTVLTIKAFSVCAQFKKIYMYLGVPELHIKIKITVHVFTIRDSYNDV